MPRASPAGLYYEVLVSNWLQSQGYRTRIRQRSRRIGEADIVATKGRIFKEISFVECKDKDEVKLRDFHRFASKFKKFLDNEPKAHALLVFRGELHPDVKDYWKNTMDKDLAERINLKRRTRDHLRRYTKL